MPKAFSARRTPHAHVWTGKQKTRVRGLGNTCSWISASIKREAAHNHLPVRPLQLAGTRPRSIGLGNACWSPGELFQNAPAWETTDTVSETLKTFKVLACKVHKIHRFRLCLPGSRKEEKVENGLVKAQNWSETFKARKPRCNPGPSKGFGDIRKRSETVWERFQNARLSETVESAQNQKRSETVWERLINALGEPAGLGELRNA